MYIKINFFSSSCCFATALNALWAKNTYFASVLLNLKEVWVNAHMIHAIDNIRDGLVWGVEGNIINDVTTVLKKQSQIELISYISLDWGESVENC